jgi:pyruvate/2-oxoglutarate dehydrogenase complex dihydrolipoamide acyltransferase (E2) component
MPSFGMYTADGVLVSWLHAAGAPVREGEAVLEIETDKATHEVPAPVSGLLHHVLPVGTEVKEQMVIGYVLAEGETPPTPGTAGSRLLPPHESRPAGNAAGGDATGDWIKASPSARRLARERGIPLAGLRGSGPGGRIVEADVLAFEGDAPAAAAEPWRVRERIPFAGIRRATAERLRQSQDTAVSLTLTREVEAQQLVDAHADLSQVVGESVPLDAFFVKFLALALRDFPALNAVVSGTELLLLDEVSIGVATEVRSGLVVPVVREADTLGIPEIGERIRELARRARAGTLRVDDIEGGTSTLTNLGAFGVDAFTPVLNPPQSSILGVGRIAPRPVSRDGAVHLLPTVWLSLTFDHRVADGVPAAQLLEAVARQMSEIRAVTP